MRTAHPSFSRGALVPTIVCRFASNLAFRFVYPFLPTIARGLGTSLGTMGVSLSIRDAATLGGLPFGQIVDRGGHRRMMTGAALVFAASCGLVAASPGVALFTIAMTSLGLAKVAYDTAMGAWIGTNVPFADRGRITGITELSWAGSFLIGIPLLAVVVEHSGWRTAFTCLAFFTAATGIWVWRTQPPDTLHPNPERIRLRQPAPGVVPLVVAVALLCFGHQLVVVTFAAWFEDSFSVDIAGLGLLAIVFGAFELCGTAATVRYTDRLGKRLSVMIGAGLAVPAMAAFGAADSTTLAVVAVGLVLLAFEFGFISALPYVTEIDPAARGANLGLLLATMTVGRMVASVVGTQLYQRSGIGAVGITAAVGSTLCVVVLASFGKEPERAS